MDERTLLFTDIVDSTQVTRRLGDEAAMALWGDHDRRARELLEELGGLEIDRTDGFFLLFADVTAAARFAIGYHERVMSLGLAARVGLHHAAVALRPNPPEAIARGAKPIEVDGLAKPLAARIMSLAAGGQTLLSGDAHAALQPVLPRGLELRSHGHYRLKGHEDPLALFELGDEHAGFVPPADADKAYRVVADGDLWKPLRAIRHNLPPERDSFVGRSAELRELARRLDAGARLVTLTGVGGTGKTRLARRYAQSWLGDWPGGVTFCDLSDARSLEGICFAVASALQVPLGKDNPVEQLGHAIDARGRSLLVLDNIEQVVGPASRALSSWLDLAGAAAFVATSRERLRVRGEEVLEVEPLPVHSDAIELFVARARSQAAGFELDDVARDAVAEVVQLLDGLPLAIELAAARVRVLSPAQIVDRLRDRFQLLSGARGSADRQATLKAAIDWSWNLLAPWEQSAMAQCSVFEGGFWLEAAEQVLDLSHWSEAPPVLDVLQALIDKSLLRSGFPKAGMRLEIAEPHFAMYLSVRDYAAQRLVALHEADATQRRHGGYFAEYGSDASIDALSIQGGMVRRQRLALETDNLVSACRRGLLRRDATTAAAVFRAAAETFDLQGPYATTLEMGLPLLEMPELPDQWRVRTLAVLGRAAGRAGRPDQAQALLEQARLLAIGLQDARGEWTATAALGRLLQERGCLEAAAAMLHDLATRLVAAGQHRLEGQVLAILAVARFQMGSAEESLALFRRAVAIHRECGDRRLEASSVGNLGACLLRTGSLEEAQACLNDAARLNQEIGDLVGVGNALLNLGLMHSERGAFAEAFELIDQALQHYRRSGSRRFEGEAIGNLGLVCQHRGHRDAARAHFDAALAIHRETGNRRSVAITLAHLGGLDVDCGVVDRARRLLEESARLFGEIGDRSYLAMVQRELARVCVMTDRLQEAAELLDQAEPTLRENGDPSQLGLLACQRGHLAARHGDATAANASCAEAQAMAAANGIGPSSELGVAIAALRAMLI